MQIWFAQRRYEELDALLASHGFAIAARESRWDERSDDDPPVGYVRVHGWPLDERGKVDRRVTVTLTERWSPQQPTSAATEHQGHWRTEYAYVARIDGVSRTTQLRYDFDPERHPEMPYHSHSLSGDRTPWRPFDPGEFMQAVQQRVANAFEEGQLE